MLATHTNNTKAERARASVLPSPSFFRPTIDRISQVLFLMVPRLPTAVSSRCQAKAGPRESSPDRRFHASPSMIILVPSWAFLPPPRLLKLIFAEWKRRQVSLSPPNLRHVHASKHPAQSSGVANTGPRPFWEQSRCPVCTNLGGSLRNLYFTKPYNR